MKGTETEEKSDPPRKPEDLARNLLVVGPSSAIANQERRTDVQARDLYQMVIAPMRKTTAVGWSWSGSRSSKEPIEEVVRLVLTNQMAADASGAIARGIAPLLLASDDPATPEKLAEARKIFEGLQHGTIDRSLFTDNANSYFDEQAVKDFATSLGPLGIPEEFVQLSQGLRGGMKLRVYTIKFPKMELQGWTYEMPDGKLEQ
jgi:hypothetical protein